MDSSIATPTLLEPEALHADVDADALLIHVADPAAFADGHIPGAVLVEPRELVSGVPPATGRLPEKAALQQLFSRIGYKPGQLIIAYDDEGGGWAGRFLWTLDIIGHHNWGYLNGGIHAWMQAGYAVDRGWPEPPAAPAALHMPLTLDQSPIAEIEDVLATIDDPQGVVWDVRSAEEYAGRRQAAARSGHIPGAINLDWNHLKDPANALRLLPNMVEVLGQHGITADKQIVTHCQTHHRSGLSYMIGRLYGFPQIRAYHGSWSEWGNREDTPIEL